MTTDLAPARSIVVGLLMVAPFWVGVAAVIFR